MHRPFLSVVAAVGITACGASKTPDAAPVDAKAPATTPAVVSVPKNLPPLAIDSTPTHKSTVIPDDPLQRTGQVSALFALATATMVNQDGGVLSQLYAPDAVLHVPDSTVTGSAAITRYLLDYARSKSLTDFQRTSRALQVLDDSTLADSGTYVMILKRSAKDSVLERGQYAARVRARPGTNSWVVLDDHLRPGAPGRKTSR